MAIHLGPLFGRIQCRRMYQYEYSFTGCSVFVGLVLDFGSLGLHSFFSYVVSLCLGCWRLIVSVGFRYGGVAYPRTRPARCLNQKLAFLTLFYSLAGRIFLCLEIITIRARVWHVLIISKVYLY